MVVVVVDELAERVPRLGVIWVAACSEPGEFDPVERPPLER